MGDARRGRATITAVVAGCLGLLGIAVLREAPPSRAVEFIPVGHWVYHSEDSSAYHVDGSTGQVDARVDVPGAEADSQVAQGDGAGYVVERKRITIFDESTLRVEDAQDPPSTERPVVLEVAGGPYLVYRNAGQVVRLGDPAATVSAGGPLSDPVATGDGTVWLHRIDSGALCALPRGATRLSCPVRMARQHHGALTVIDDRAALVDTTDDTLRLVRDDGFGASRPIGFDVPAAARVAAADAGGRLAVLDAEHGRMHLVDTAGLAGRPESAPVEVRLPGKGEFLGPVAVDDVVAVVDTTRNVLLTYDGTGEHRETTDLPAVDGEPRLVAGEDDRIYVDSPGGTHVLVVNGEDGSVRDVPVAVPDEDATVPAAAPPTPEPPAPTETRPESPPPVAEQPPDTGEPAPGPVDVPADEPVDEPAVDTPPPPVAAATPPGAPGAVTAVAGHQSAEVSWQPAPDNGAPVVAYHLSWPGGSTRVVGTAGHATVSGLANGTSYAFTVAAENAAGVGPAASAAAVVPSRPAAAPVITLPPPVSGQPVTWTQPELYGGTLVHYVVGVSGEADRTTTQPSMAVNPFSGTATTVTVRAVTRFGPAGAPLVDGEPASAEITTPLDFPSALIVGVAWAGGDQLAVTIDATSQSPATCEVRVNGGATTSGPCAGRVTFTLAGVVADALGTVQVVVQVRNAAGQSGAPASWIGAPDPPGTGGGFVLWLGPAALAVARRWTSGRRRTHDERKDTVSP